MVIVETGAIVSGANSYVSEADLTAYALARGITLSDTPEILILKAMDYFESFAPRFKGCKVERDQPLSWPRTGVNLEGWDWSYDEIPRQVINAQLSLCIEISAGEDPNNPSSAVLPTIRERVEGAIEVEYANPGQPLKVQKTQPSSVHIRMLLNNSGMFAVRA